jgi:uncharacterized Fe-S center protein
MSEVFFVPRKSDLSNSLMDGLIRLIGKMRFGETLKKNDFVAIKTHFGERGLTTFLRPIFMRPFSDEIRRCGARPFLTDANTIYQGSRSDGVQHLETALMNGFGYTVTGAPVVIADGLSGEDYVDVRIDADYFDTVSIAGEACRANAMIVLTHFKGHEMFGFGGALKNIGMGLAAKKGKLTLHSTAKPYVKKKSCTGCGICFQWCRVQAIEAGPESSVIVREKCTGCGQCIMSCPSHAITLKWDMSFSEGQKKTAEYALGAVKNKTGSTWYFNFILDVTPECDCYSYSDSSIAPDIGIMASRDPVSIDQASYDLVNESDPLPSGKAAGVGKGQDKFRAGHPEADGRHLLEHAEKIGLGERKYELVRL